MSLIDMFASITEHLIGLMFTVLVLALLLRFLAYRSGKKNQAYFNSFSHSVIKLLEEEEEKHENVQDVESWLDDLLARVEEHLPDRSLRFSKTPERSDRGPGGGIRRESLRDYADGKRSIIISIKQQADAFKSPYPPNFPELTDRVLEEDTQWRNILRVIPVETLSRMLDVLPGLFIVGGIFGTFIGITAALPMIASIDLTNLAEATPVLNEFVSNVAYSMNTSIAGIICSVITTILTAMFPLTSVRDDVAKNMERATEFMWYRIHGNKPSQGENQLIAAIQSLEKNLVAELRALREHRGDSGDPVKKVS